MEKLTLVLLVAIPSGMMLLLAYFLINRFLDREQKAREQEVREKLAKLQLETEKTLFPLRLQAYERIILFLERVHPNSMVMRLHKQNQLSMQLHAEMLRTIREEYEHNMTQQMYMSDGAWEVIRTAKEETIKILNSAYGNVKETDKAVELASEIFRLTAAVDRMPTDIALEVVKKEVRKYFKE
jgi:hypothetical protein